MPSSNFELRRKLLQLEALYDVGRALNTLRPESELLEEVMHRAVGVLDAAQGFAFSLDEKLNVQNLYTFEIDVSSWGWIHLILGILGGVIAIGILMNQTWGRLAGIAIASLSAINGFLFMPYYPVWALVIIAFDVFVIWALCFQLTDPDEY